MGAFPTALRGPAFGVSTDSGCVFGGLRRKVIVLGIGGMIADGGMPRQHSDRPTLLIGSVPIIPGLTSAGESAGTTLTRFLTETW